MAMESNRVFTVNRGINKPLEFKGLKAQYIWHLAGSAVGVLVGYGLLHWAGVCDYVGLPLALALGGLLINRVYRLSKKYGQHGLMKRGARKMVPKALLSRSRNVFIHL
jgi:Domain of unknown function (DUF4133)